MEYSGNIIPVELAVYDNDGQPGIFIPGSMEANAVKEMAANMGQNLGTTISITNQSAGNQLLSELGKGRFRVCRSISPEDAPGEGAAEIRPCADALSETVTNININQLNFKTT